ncbi:MAG: SDR family oxidoreductase [Pseudomonadota bacterium]
MHQSVLVTGASSGIGEACAVFLAHKGFRVFAAARRIEKLKELEGIAGGRIAPITLDVTDDASVAEALSAVEEQAGGLYGLVNNAGVSVMGPVETTPIDEWRRQYETNVFAVVRMCQAVLPQMRAAGRGRIVNIGSIAGRIASPFQGVYASSKHAVEGISDALRRELAPHGVKVSLVRPGFINTPFGHQEQEGLAAHAKDGEPYADQVKTYKAWHAKGHPNAPGPNVVAEAVHHALTAEKPHSRYAAPKKSHGYLAMRNLLPMSANDEIIYRLMGLKKK